MYIFKSKEKCKNITQMLNVSGGIVFFLSIYLFSIATEKLNAVLGHINKIIVYC